jgi:hypothetical protein
MEKQVTSTEVNLTLINKLLKKMEELTVVEKSNEDSLPRYYEVLELNKELYLKVEYYKDSYGYKEFVGMQFVKPTVIKLTEFQSI